MRFDRDQQELQSLWDIAQSLYQYINIDDLILHIIKRIIEVMPVEAVSVILYDERTDELVFCWSDAPERAKKLEAIRFPADQGIAGSVFWSGNAEIVLDVEKDPRHYIKVDTATGFLTKSMIAVPLRTKDRTIGVLEVLNKREGSFDEKDLHFLLTLAPITAMALDNARMYTELHRDYKELQVINKGKDSLIKQTQNEVDFLRREVERRYRFNQIVGASEAIVDVFRLCEKVIDTDITVLIQGETGTGKELIARTIHYNGMRKTRQFVAQNCGGIPDTLLASELFGHKKGAFTGALRTKRGLFEVGHGGTVFLDEVAEMSPAMQTSLLRVLQEGEIKPLGSDLSKRVDIRLISATNKDLEEKVRQGRFREDLFYRLNVFTIELPPLRQRHGDVAILANHFVKKLKQKYNKSIRGLHRDSLGCLSAYSFPGNVRELENEIERALAMAGDEEYIQVFHLSQKIRQGSVTDALGLKEKGTLKEMVEELERSVLAQTLEKQRGNKSKSAEELGLSRHGLRKKMQRYGF